MIGEFNNYANHDKLELVKREFLFSMFVDDPPAKAGTKTFTRTGKLNFGAPIILKLL